ncbi:hypothetical protein BSY239_2459 [Hydrogenophaga sp. RAC07]|uniref:hypothetical protein n=1 Tax=Hydrogenophaga sp. RAC07 TaxID=1842537 RepID=UPI000858A567|nr:hypothetical protein [Hydrogenophaga sp. RAC07]AOF85375.1 hypothetical protein BSY239_2459 [Hydrogenophaga sp. RAC07]
MPITFEEVTAEVPAERPSPPTVQANEAASPDDPRALEAMQQALDLRAERIWRLHTD